MKDKDGEQLYVFYLRKNGKTADPPMWKQYEIILCNEIGEPRLYPEGNPITVIRLPPKDTVTRVFRTEPDERDNVKQIGAGVGSITVSIQITFGNNDSGFEDIISYNDILD